MEYLPGGFTLEIPKGAFPLSTDSVLLSDFAKLPKGARVADLGSGCGTLGILLCSANPNCTVVGFERDETAHLGAEENIARNGLSARMESICADLRSIPTEFAAGSFQCCVSNPPYFTGGPASRTVPNARRTDTCSTRELMEAAARLLKFGGDFFLVQKPERLAEICGAAAAVHLEPKRLRIIRHDPGSPVNLILVSCRKGGKPGLIWEEETLFSSDGSPTQYYRSIYHL